MGVWGTGIFSDDIACDVRDYYREQIEDGVDDAEGTRRTIEKFHDYFDDPEAGAALVVAFAVTQSKIGRLDPAIRDRALTVIDNGSDLARWERDNPRLVAKRREALLKARSQLTGPQPTRKRLRPPARPGCGLVAGDVLSLTLPGRLVLLRVVRVLAHRRGETPVLEELDSNGSDVPSIDELERLQPRVENHINLFGDHRFFIFEGGGWEQAGFRKVATVAPRPEDEDAHVPESGRTWQALADRFGGKRGA